MNLAIEYMLRDKRAHGLLALPCALFVLDPDGRKMVIGLQNAYVSSANLTVKHWRLWESKPGDRLPPFSEFRVQREDVFTSDRTVVPGCRVLEFTEEPYQAGVKQVADYPQGQHQQAEYAETLDNFYNTVAHRRKKLDWLWAEFERIHVPETLRFEYGNADATGRQLQRDLVQFYCKSTWATWLFWRRHLLDFPAPAPELVFRRDYVPADPVPLKVAGYGFTPTWSSQSYYS